MEEKPEGERSGVPRLRVLLALFAALLVVGVAVGCGDDDSSSESASGGDSGSSTQAADVAEPGAQAPGAGVDDYLKYVGGKAGAADSSKAPITIGWVNQQGGPTDVGPGSTSGAEMAVKYVNDELGGVDGHPIKLATCFTSTSEEQGQACGQKLANNKDVNVIVVGALAIGDQSLTAAIAGEKPMVYGVALGPTAATNKNGYSMFGDGPRVTAPLGTYIAKVLKAKTAAIVWPELPGIIESARAVVAEAEKGGVKVKGVSWAPNATDLVGPLTAAGGQSADVIALISDAKACVNLSKAIDQLGIETPVVSAPLCINTLVSKALGDYPKWTYSIGSSLASDTSDPTAVAYAKVAKQYDMEKEALTDNWVATSFHDILTVVQWMNKIGVDNVSAETIAEQAKAFRGPMAWGAPTIDCGKYPKFPAVCNDQSQFFKYEGGGKFTPAQSWTGPIE